LQQSSSHTLSLTRLLANVNDHGWHYLSGVQAGGAMEKIAFVVRC
jgi:hypothetical protein